MYRYKNTPSYKPDFSRRLFHHPFSTPNASFLFLSSSRTSAVLFFLYLLQSIFFFIPCRRIAFEISLWGKSCVQVRSAPISSYPFQLQRSEINTAFHYSICNPKIIFQSSSVRYFLSLTSFLTCLLV